MKISVSFLKSNKSTLDTILEINQTSSDYLHVDLMDGKFCGEKNYEINEILTILSKSTKPLDIHLMMKNPGEIIEKLAILNPKYITVHKEIDNVAKYLKLIKGLGISAGISIKPDTPISSIENDLELIDLVLVMSVEPGRGGQKFLPSTVKKLKDLESLRKKTKCNFLISCDGGIDEKTIEDIDFIDIAVSGSFVCMSDNYESQIEKLKHQKSRG